MEYFKSLQTLFQLSFPELEEELTSSLSHNFIFCKSLFSSEKCFVKKKKKTTTTVIPHILDSNGVICLLHFTGYLKTNCTILVHHPFWHLSGKSCGRPYRARRQHSQWGVQIENTSSIVRSKISGDCPYAERLCSDLARGLLGAA